MTSEKIIGLPRLHDAQISIVKHPARYKVIAAGRRFGKGILTMSEMFKRASQGKKCRWVAPSYASDSYQAGWGMADYLARQIPGVQRHFQRKEFDFTELGGAWVQFRTAEEPDGLRGEGIDFAAFDEAAHIKGLQDIWEQSVRASLMDRSGDAWFISTPKGFNYFNTLYNMGRDGVKDWASFHFSTKDNPTIKPEEIDALRKSLPGLVARQEIDAEFVQLAGAVFKRENIRVIDAEPPGLRWVRSWDLAFTVKTTSDFTAGARVAMDGSGTVIVGDMVHGRMEWPDAVRCIANTARMDGRDVVQGVEVVGAQVGALQTLLRDPMLLGYTFKPVEVHKDKLTRALPMVARSEQQKFAIVRASWNQKFLDELCSFDGSGDGHDDMVDATSAAMHMIESPGGGITSASQIIFGSRRATIQTAE